MGAARRSFCLSKHHHPSRSEADYCNWLLARKQGGEIRDYKAYVSVPLMIKGKLWRRWKIDFLVQEKDGTESYHESKGWNRSDQCFKMKRDVFLICYPDHKLYINKELYTGKPERRRVTSSLLAVSRKNKKAARNRKIVRMRWTNREYMK